jgi:hypothetical protein
VRRDNRTGVLSVLLLVIPPLHAIGPLWAATRP